MLHLGSGIKGEKGSNHNKGLFLPVIFRADVGVMHSHSLVTHPRVQSNIGAFGSA